MRRLIPALLALLFSSAPLHAAGLERLKYNNPGLVVDLGVGLWAWPVPGDADGDSDPDLIVVCPDVPYNGTWFFENDGREDESGRTIFKPAKRLSAGAFQVTPSYVTDANGKTTVRVMTPATEYPDFFKTGLSNPQKLKLTANVHGSKIRFNQWRYVDYDGDGALDLTIGIEDWADYGWDRAFNEKGEWTRGPLHGHIYLLRNKGTTDKPNYEEPTKIQAGGKVLDVFGCPSQSFADFDGDGDLDLICGEFLDGFTYFQNTGTRTKPVYAAGERLLHLNDLKMDLQMLIVVPFDWDSDGNTDLIVGQEDGRVALLRNQIQEPGKQPKFSRPEFFLQEADEVKFGVLCTPVGFDWDEDGDEDIVSGNSAGYIGWIENLGPVPGQKTPKFAAPVLIKEDTLSPIRIQAGKNGSIQGPAEAKWGYTTICVADWDHDGVADIVANSIWCKVVWWRSEDRDRKFGPWGKMRPIEVEWPAAPPKPAWTWWNPQGKELATQWRTTPLVHDFTGDGLLDLAMLDQEGYLALFPRAKKNDKLLLLPPQRIFFGVKGSDFDSGGKRLNDTDGPLRLNVGEAGKSGRRKLSVVDWDGDGLADLLVNGRNATFFKCLKATKERIEFQDIRALDDRQLAGHDTSPTTVDWNRDGKRELLVGAEDGFLYYAAP